MVIDPCIHHATHRLLCHVNWPFPSRFFSGGANEDMMGYFRTTMTYMSALEKETISMLFFFNALLVRFKSINRFQYPSLK